MAELGCFCLIFFTASFWTPDVHGEGDGFKNNINNPTWGMAGSRLLRFSPVHYEDGAYTMVSNGRPNPMEVSLAVHMGVSGQPSMFSRNAMQAFFAQMVMDEIVSVTSPGCPPEYENLKIPEDHPLARWTGRPQVYIRSMYDQTSGYTSSGPRQQQNQVSSFLDGSIIYGSSHVWTNLLRSFKDGQLLADDDSNQYNFPAYNDIKLPLVNAPIPKTHDLKSVERLLRIGNPTGHETPFLLVLQVVWFRWHNLVAKRIISEAAPAQLSDAEIFDAAKKKVIAHFQKIVMTEWFPFFLNGDHNGTSALPAYEGYNRYIHPGISQEFLVAMSFRHSLSPAAVWKLAINESSQTCHKGTTEGQDADGNPRNVKSFRLCNNFWDSQELVKSNLDDILRGLVHTMAEKEDEKFVKDFTEFFYGPYEYSRRDFVANEIQRFRDHGVPSLNTVLTSFDLPVEDNWDRLKFANGTIRQLYGGDRPENVDLFTAGLMEEMDSLAGMSDIFRKIIIDQFTRIRDGDSSWYQREGMFTPDELNDIESMTFRQILMETTSLSDADLPSNVFLCNGNGSICDCLNPPNIDDPTDPEVDVCTPLWTHDYIKGSEGSFAVSFTLLALVVPASILILRLLKYRKTKTKVEVKKRTSSAYVSGVPNRFRAKEWLGPESGYRAIKGEMDCDKKRIVIKSTAGKELRYLDVDTSIECCCSNDSENRLVVLKTPGDIDLILKFVSQTDRDQLIHQLQQFTSTCGINMETSLASESELLQNCSHRDDRQKELDAFFRMISQKIMAGEKDRPVKRYLRRSQDFDHQISKVKQIQLTMTEFADALGLQPSSVFVQNIFLLADRDNDNRISFQEFLDLFAVFLKGTAEEKARLVFDVYDIEGKGEMSEDDFNRMIRSFLEMGDNTSTMSNDEISELVTSLFRQAGKAGGSNMDFEHFQSVFCSGHYASVLQAATLPGEASKHALKPPTVQSMARRKSKRTSFLQSYRLKGRAPIQENGTPSPSSTLTRSGSLVKTINEPSSKWAKRWHYLSRQLKRYRWQIFWMILYTMVTIGIFVERAYYFAVGREHTGLRRISGPWVVASIRGSASVIMFTFVSLLVTMCRNTITALRETFLHRFIPFDSAVAFHKYIAVLAMIGILIHIVGHAINLYSMSTQTAESLNCFFSEYYTLSDKLPHFHFWLYQTITGLAGVAVTILIFVMYVFASQYSRRHVFKAFWFTHSLYWLVYVLTFLHGIGRLVQAPLFPWFLVGPVILFVLDRLKSVSRKKVEIAVTSSTALPSGVTRLIFKRPESFSYRSGQWVRIACLALGKDEYHPFTLTSAPHEPNLSLHIRAVGPWTKALRKIYTNTEEKLPPKLYVDGPFGEGHQDWYTADVAVLVGGGIGVTPFASILKDIAFKSKSGIPLTCKRVYFLWVTKSQKGFEWMLDIVREAEMADTRGIVETHVFVTQFPQKYDLRTTMLYICERHFQKMESRSIFTGLKSVTHFGRPNFEDLFMAIAREFKDVSQIGVFSCGPGPMTSSVQAGCSRMNSFMGPTFTHHFENF